MSSHRSTIAALDLDPLDAQIRQVFFFDTPDLDLNQAGVVARARRVKDRDHDSVVKLRPVVPSELPADVRRSPNLSVEVDVIPGAYVCSASCKRTPRPDRDPADDPRRAPPAEALLQGAAGLLHGPRPRGARHRRSLDPRAHLRAQAEGPAEDLQPTLRRGDVAVPRRLAHPRAVHEVRAGRRAPGRRRASGTSSGARASSSAAEQQTKTKSALEFYSAELRAARG